VRFRGPELRRVVRKHNTACQIFNHTLIPSPGRSGSDQTSHTAYRRWVPRNSSPAAQRNDTRLSLIIATTSVTLFSALQTNGNITSICPAIKGVLTLAISPPWGSIRTVTTIATRKQTFSRFRTLAPVITEPSSKTEATAANPPKDSNGTT